MYFFDYAVKPRPTEPVRRLKTIFSVGHSGPTDMLITFTVQATQDKYDADPALASVLQVHVICHVRGR